MKTENIYNDIKSMEKSIEQMIYDFNEKHGPFSIEIETEQIFMIRSIGSDRKMIKNRVTVKISN